MTGDSRPTMATTTVRALAATAQLPLPADREETVAAPLREWLNAANELSRKMSAPEFATLAPVVAFVHPDTPRAAE